MDLEQLIPYFKRLDKVNTGIEDFTELFSEIHDGKTKDLTLSTFHDYEVDDDVIDAYRGEDIELGSLGSLFLPDKPRTKVTGFNMEGDFALRIVAGIIKSLEGERRDLLNTIESKLKD